MARTILLTFLDDAPAANTPYYLQNKKAPLTGHYVQEALIQLLHKEAAITVDVVYGLLTKATKRYNWDHRCVVKRVLEGGIEYELEEGKGLACALARQEVGRGKLEAVAVEALGEGDHWTLFDHIEAVVESGDQVILEITHGVRFMPMLGMLLLRYLEKTKGIVVKGIYYGDGAMQQDGLIPLVELTHWLQAFPKAEDWRNGLQAVEWCLQHHLLQQSITLLQETVVTYLCLQAGLDHTTKAGRDAIAHTLHTQTLLSQGNSSNQQLAKQYQMTTPFLSNELLAVYNSLNSMAKNHSDQGSFSSTSSPQQLEENLTTNLKAVKEILLTQKNNTQ